MNKQINICPGKGFQREKLILMKEIDKIIKINQLVSTIIIIILLSGCSVAAFYRSCCVVLLFS